MRSLVVFGGSGFLGQAIIQHALSQNIPVISISRSGKPKIKESWPDNSLVKWVASDVLEETNWQKELADGQTVINLIGLRQEKPKNKLTFQRYHVEINQIILKQLQKKTDNLYLYLSARSNGPLLAKEYLTSKREAEKRISASKQASYILRPGLVVGKERLRSLVEGALIRFFSHFPWLGKLFKSVYPIPIDLLAREIIQLSQGKLPKTPEILIY